MSDIALVTCECPANTGKLAYAAGKNFVLKNPSLVDECMSFRDLKNMKFLDFCCGASEIDGRAKKDSVIAYKVGCTNHIETFNIDLRPFDFFCAASDSICEGFCFSCSAVAGY